MTREIWALATQDVPTNLAMTLFLDLIMAAVFVACWWTPRCCCYCYYYYF